MKTKIATVVLLFLPLVFAGVNAWSFHIVNRNNGTIVSAGQKREYLLYVPRTYDGTKPVPLVISMHGAGGWPAQQADVSRWNRLAERGGFIVVYPSGFDGAGPRIWRVRDARFIADLLTALERTYAIDGRRVYADGLSNGGGMAFVLSCSLGDRIAAVGMVASAQTVPFSWCRSDRAVPMIMFHGTADPVVPYRGGASWSSAGESFPDIAKWTARWAQRNRCATQPVESRVTADVMRREYTGCVSGATVVLYTIQAGGHTWPAGGSMPEWLVGPKTRSVDATRELWAFFRAHPLQ